MDLREAQPVTRKSKSLLAQRAGVLTVPILILVVWQIASLALGKLALPSPRDTAAVLADGVFGNRWLLRDLKDTMLELFFGYALAVLVGLLLGFSLGIYRFLREVFEPFVLNIYAIPKVTLFPIFLFLFGLGIESKIAFGFFHGVFPIIIMTMGAIKDIKPIYFKVGRSLRLKAFAVSKEIVFPLVLPSMMSGMRLGFNLTILGVILGEMAASRSGLGYMLMKSEAVFYMEKILAIVLVLAIIAISVNLLFYRVERRLSREESVRVLDAIGYR